MNSFIGVKIALIHDNDVLVIQRDTKPGLRFAGLWDFAGGGREESETPYECIAREVHEELSINISRSDINYSAIYPAMHDSSQNAYFMVASITQDQIDGIKFGNEGRGWRMMDIGDFMSSQEVVMPLKPRLSDYLNSLEIGGRR